MQNIHAILSTYLSCLPEPVDLGRVAGHVEPAPGVLLEEGQVVPLVEVTVLLGLLEDPREVDLVRLLLLGRLVLPPVPVRVEHAAHHTQDVLHAVLHDLRHEPLLLRRRRNVLHLCTIWDE